MTLAPLGDSAVVVTLGNKIDELTLLRVRSLTSELVREKSPDIIDVVPAYTTVTVFYEIVPNGMTLEPPYERVCRFVTNCLKRVEDRWPELVRANSGKTSRLGTDQAHVIEIPVCYGGEFGSDIDEVARLGGVSTEDVAVLHSGVVYEVHAIGFTPGFPYLAGLPEKLHVPRRSTPRMAVPAGSVGIGGRQTGIYPLSSPGGWQLIGRTPQTLFDVNHHPPALLLVGDRVKFKPISPQEFETWR